MVKLLAYSELIKNFSRIRNYIRQFYVYGFKSRGEYRDKSLRSYDNERRRIESWLGKYMYFRKNEMGKTMFMSVDSQTIPYNPLYQAFKAKSFTVNDIILHFYILDILTSKERCTVREIVERIDTEYLSSFPCYNSVDESTVRKKLKEYERIGFVQREQHGRQILYARANTNIDLAKWKIPSSFFTEAAPLGIVGYFLLDRYENKPNYFAWRQHYILHALESEVLLVLLNSIREHRSVLLELYVSRMEKKQAKQMVIPLKVYVSTQNGRRYLMSWHCTIKKIMLFRIDNIKNAYPRNVEIEFDKYLGYGSRFQENLWGVSSGVDFSMDHVEMIILVNKGEKYILKRLEHEKRCGNIETINDQEHKFIADVYDAAEMLPWIRTYIGYIKKLESNNEYLVKSFYEDLKRMNQIYGGEGNTI